MNLFYATTRFITSATQCNQFPEDKGNEVAFAGRSNSGKSSVINAICRQKTLARISNTPGRTQMINFFQVNTQHRLVDLPGYGYAKASIVKRRQWQALIERYLIHRKCLRGIILVMDIRHPLTPFDWQMLDWCSYYKFSVYILLNKADKLSHSRSLSAVQTVKKTLADRNVGLQAFSAVKKSGLDKVYDVLDRWLCDHESGP